MTSTETPPVPGTSPDARQPVRAERVPLRDGSLVTVRQVLPGDERAVAAFLAELGVEARRMRFFSAAVDLGTAAHWAVEPPAPGLGLVASAEDGRIVGHAAYVKLDEARAEVAVEVADALHGQGLGTILVERLARIAEARGVTQFVAEVLPENRRMLVVFKDGFDATIRFCDGVDRVRFPTAAWRLAHERFAVPAVRPLRPSD